MKIFSNQYVRYNIILIGGILLGWIFFHSSPGTEEKHDHAIETVKSKIWTCAMHPQIRMHEPGKCPICAMDLILLSQYSTETIDPTSVHLTKEAAQLANVMTSVVSRQNPQKEVRLYGKVQADERLLQDQVSHISGRVEKLFVNFTGEAVRKGQKLALIYSPELVTAQQELLEAAKTKEAQPAIYDAAKEKLRQWKLTNSQISTIENSGNVESNVEVESATSGIVTARRVNKGDYVSQGSVLYEVSDLSSVWVLFDAFESDLPFLKIGDRIDFTIQALPGSSFSGNIRFIDPVLEPVNRVAKVRVEIGNPGAKLKPEMFATGIVKSNLIEFIDKLIVPQTAVLWTGKRSVVYVKQPDLDEPVFKIREIVLGPLLGSSYVVDNGLDDGEIIVTEGAFSVDAAAQLEGKPSMMNPAQGNLLPTSALIIGERSIDGVTQSHPVKLTKLDPNSQFKQLIINVSGNCEMCKDRIEKTAGSINGVLYAEWNINSKMLSLKIDDKKTTSDIIQQTIAQTGHDTEKYLATNDSYNKLPECCLYRKKSK